MGCRGLYGFRKRTKQGKIERIGIYNHWDCDPLGLGTKIASFILAATPEQLAESQRKAENLTWINECDESVGILDYTFSFPMILSGEMTTAIESMYFLADGLFCEWAYFVDFDDQVVEVWKNGHPYVNRGFEYLGNGFMKKLMEKSVRDDEIYGWYY